jgi:soluble lytic murein transglycosylase
MRPAVKEAAVENQLDPLLVASIIWNESGYRTQLISARGERGLMQVQPNVLKELERVHRLPPDIDDEGLLLPEPNVQAGTAYLRYIATRFNGNDERAARLRFWFGETSWLPVCHAYNAGPTLVQRLIDGSCSREDYEMKLKEKRPTTRRYGERVERIYTLLHWIDCIWPY